MVAPRSRLRRACVVLAVAAALWSVVAAITGGVSVPFLPFRLSSRNPRNPFLVALLSAAAAWIAAPAGGRIPAIAADWAWLIATLQAVIWRAWSWWVEAECFVEAQSRRWLAPLLVGIAALAVVIVGFREGALVAAASDAYGYVSQAHLWATGTLRVEQPLMRELSVEIPRQALAPLAYRPAPEGTAIVPVTAPGLPMMMAIFEIVGGANAVFYVVPLLAAVAVWASYILGERLAGPWAGVLTALFLATSPSFLFQLTSSPMSDIPVTAWWAISLALILRHGAAAALTAGVTAGAAILTRPNLVPLALFPAALLVWRAVRARLQLGQSARPLLMFAAGTIPACMAIGILNTFWYGSPLESGYGPVGEIYRWDFLWPNLERYPRWVLESQTPIVALAVVAPLLLWWRARAQGNAHEALAHSITLLCFVIAVFACYVFYQPFDVWWFVRFVLPAFPPLLALTSAVIVITAASLPRGLRLIGATAVVLLVTQHNIAYARAGAAFASEGEWKYAITGRYVAEHLPERAVLLAMQHSGSIRYYSGRVTIRFDLIPSSKLGWVLDEIRRLGYRPYVLVEDWEEPDFRARFKDEIAVSVLDRPPIAELPLGKARIYEARD